MVESTIKYLAFFKSKSLKQHASKRALQEPFTKKWDKVLNTMNEWTT